MSLSAGGCGKSPSTGEQQPPAGILQGKVTISPIFPHERMGAPPNEASARIYKAHRAAIYPKQDSTQDAKQERKAVAEKALDENGRFQFELPPGEYEVDILPHDIGIRPGRGLPVPATVKVNETTELAIELDTGIR